MRCSVGLEVALLGLFDQLIRRKITGDSLSISRILSAEIQRQME